MWCSLRRPLPSWSRPRQETARERLHVSLVDLEAGRTNRYEDADALMRALDADDT